VTVSALWPWIAFNLAVVAVLALDLGVFHRRPHVISLKEATVWRRRVDPAGVRLQRRHPAVERPAAALQFLVGYLIEKSLSVEQYLCLRSDLHVLRRAGGGPAPVLFWGFSVRSS